MSPASRFVAPRLVSWTARAAVAALVVLALAVPSGADSGSDARARRDAARRQRAAAAAQLDTLRASDVQLESALAELDAHLSTQTAQVASARRAVEAADAHAAATAAQLEATRGRIFGLRDAAVDRAVDAYVRPDADLVSQLFESADWRVATRRDALLRQVNGAGSDVLDRLDAAEEDEHILTEQARAAAASAAALRSEQEAELDALQQARDERARMAAALDARIAEVQSEIDSLSRQDAALTEIIRQGEAAAAARRAAASRAAAGGSGRGSGGSGGSGGARPAPAAPDSRASSAGLAWPLRGAVTSEYGQRWGRLHAGLDIDGNTGDPIYAAGAGEVIFSGAQSGYGNVVIIAHGGGISTLYAHQSRRGVSQGEQVSRGQLIGYVGSTGRSTGPHLHFEVRVNGTAQNPRRWLP